MTAPGAAIGDALAKWLDGNAAPDAIGDGETAEQAFIAGAAAERDRIRRLAAEHFALCHCEHDEHWHDPFADLLDLDGAS